MATYTHPITGEAKEYIPYTELTDTQRTWVDSADVVLRQGAAERGWGVDYLANDSDWQVRRVVAEQGFALETLLEDENDYVRFAVARQGFGLQRLVDDLAWFVRKTVAEHGQALDRLIDDADVNVRMAVASQGYCLDRLVGDTSKFVRAAVADQGYGLDALVDDDSRMVVEAANEYLRTLEQPLRDWIDENHDKCALPENRCTSYAIQQDLDKLLKDKDPDLLNIAESLALEFAWLNVETGEALMPDMSVNYNDELVLHGFMGAFIDRKRVAELLNEDQELSVWEVLQETMGAPGSGAQDRMGWVPFCGIETVIETAERLRSEPGWQLDSPPVIETYAFSSGTLSADPTLGGAKAAQKGRLSVEQGGSGPRL